MKAALASNDGVEQKEDKKKEKIGSSTDELKNQGQLRGRKKEGETWELRHMGEEVIVL